MYRRSKVRRSQRKISTELRYSIPFSIFSAHVFIGFLQEGSYFQIIFSKGYWLSLAASASIALILIIYVKLTNRYFDKKRLADQRPKLITQIAVCIVGAFGLELFCSWAYFAYLGYRIWDTVYVDYYVLPILLFIIILNFWYSEGFNFSNEPEGEMVSIDANPFGSSLTAASEPLEQILEEIETIPEKREVKPIDIAGYAAEEQIGMVTTLDGCFFARNFLDKGRVWYHNITVSIKHLPDSYVRITRNSIIHQEIIKDVKYDEDKDTISITLKSPFNCTFKVEKQYIYRFHKWCKLKKLEIRNIDKTM